MNSLDPIYLSLPEIAVVLLLSLYIAVTGRPEWAAGIYLSMAAWTRTVMIGPIAHTWVLLALLVAAAAVCKVRNPGKPLLPPRDGWIVFWMGSWWGWMFLLIAFFNPENSTILMRSLILYDLAPLPFVLLFAPDVKRIRGFVLAYIITSLIGGWEAFSALGISLDYLRADPTLTRFGVVRLGLVNYHWFSMAFAISLVFITALLQLNRRTYFRLLLLLGAGICAYVLLLGGSRQTIGAVVLILLLFGIWSLLRGGAPKGRMLVLLGLVALTGITLYVMAPQLISRSTTAGLDEVLLASVQQRAALWNIGWGAFTNSPIYGTGFTDYVYSHNIFVGVLADQGIVGMIFFLGFLVFLAKQAKGIWVSMGTEEVRVWRMAFLCVILLGLVAGLFSGSTISIWELYWAGALLWWLRSAADQPSPALPQGSESKKIASQPQQLEPFAGNTEPETAS